MKSRPQIRNYLLGWFFLLDMILFTFTQDYYFLALGSVCLFIAYAEMLCDTIAFYNDKKEEN